MRQSSSSEARVACPYCASANLPTARFCTECGRELDPQALPADEDPVGFEDEPTPFAAFRAWLARHRTALLVGGAILLVLVTGLVLLTCGDDEPPPGTQPPPPAVSDPPPAPPAAADATATGVIRAHWRAIGERDYDRAYDLLSADYRGRVSRGEWVGSHERAAPRVYARRIQFSKALSDGEAFVFADIITRDTGSSSDSSSCIRFAGIVRVIRRGDVWRYRPGGAGDTFERKGALARGDRRCGRLFS
jgi:hypothetical protein